MNKLNIQLDATELKVEQKRARVTPDDIDSIEISSIKPGSRHRLSIVPVRNSQKNKIWLVKHLESINSSVVVYSNENAFYCYRHISNNNPLASFISVKSRVLWLGLNRWHLRILTGLYITDTYNILSGYKNIKTTIYIDNHNSKRIDVPISKHEPSKLNILLKGVRFLSFPMSKLAGIKDAPINMPVQLRIEADDEAPFRYDLHKIDRYIKNPLFYYAPIKAIHFQAEKAVHVRRSRLGAVVLMRRYLEPIEKTARFRFYESRLVSFLMYRLAAIIGRISKRKINIYYEKNAAKAEEGTFEVFLSARDSTASKNFYIINNDSPDYERIKNENGVVANHRLKAYWYIYRANSVISTEAPSHVTVLRSNNRYLRKSLYGKKFVFLQHGVTYMKCQGPNSAFIVGKEAEPTYMVVGSKKERDVVVDMLRLPEERLIMSGLPIYDNVKYMNITEDSPDIVTVMLTWKPYEEHISDFSKTSYYKNTIMIFDELVKKMPPQNIRIVAHPKVSDALSRTNLKASLWAKPISEALIGTKLLITDYSSVCYNTFYQGSGVIFFQPDIKLYEAENGALIPNDNEYIGPRTFKKKDLVAQINVAINKDGRVNLDKLRAENYVTNALSINEFHDAKNVERLCGKLVELGVL